MHLDMDAFYASIEQRDNPSLRGKPVIVGGDPSKRGVVAAASYEARKFGVRSAIPSSTARRLCPGGIFLHPRMDAYKAESTKVMEIVVRTGALIERVSIDEAYLDATALLPMTATADETLQSALPLAREIKHQIRRQLGLTASIGLASNKFLAKLGSDHNKPDGLTCILESAKLDFLRPLPIRAVHGVGAVTEKALKQAGIHTIGDLRNYPADLRPLVGSFATRLRQFAFGVDDRPLELDDEIKSISAEETFERDTTDRELLRATLWQQAREVAQKLHRKQLDAKTVQVKVRYADFSTLTRQTSLEDGLADPRQIYRLACQLLAREKLIHRPVRLLGLGVSGLGGPRLRQLQLLLY